MIFKCACCRRDTDDSVAACVYGGMGLSQYVCELCKKLPFIHVWEKLAEDDSPSYIGDRLLEEVLG